MGTEDVLDNFLEVPHGTVLNAAKLFHPPLYSYGSISLVPHRVGELMVDKPELKELSVKSTL